MRDRRWRKAARELWGHRARTSLAVLAIAVGLAGSGTILNSWAFVQAATEGGFRASNPPSATLWTDSIDAPLLARVRAVPGVRDAQARRTAAVVMRAQGLVRNALLFALADFGDIRIGRVTPEVGAWPPADGTVIIERSAFEFSGASVGEPVFAGAEGREVQPLMVGGIARDVGVAPGWMERTVYGFVTPATLASLGLPSDFSELRIVVDRSLDRAGVRRIALAVRSAVESTGRTVRDVAVPEPGDHIHAAQMGSLAYTQAAFGVLALLCSGFLVLNLITAMLAGQVREIGVMKAMGARPGQVAAIYLGIAAVIGAGASALALPVALRVGRAYAEFRVHLLNFPLDGYGVPWWVVALQVAVGLLVPVAAAWFPVRRASRMSVGAALRDTGLVERAPSAALTRVRGAARPLLLSMRNAVRRRTRLALTVTALALAGATFIAAVNLRQAVQSAVDVLYAPFRYDLSLSVSGTGATADLEALVRRVPGVRAAEVWTLMRGTPEGPDGSQSDAITVAGVPVRSAVLALAPNAGRWLTDGDSAALVVPRGRIARDSLFALDKPVTLRMSGRATRWTVAGTVENGGIMAMGYGPRDAVGRTAGSTRAVVVATAVRGQAAELELIAQLRRELVRGGWPVIRSQRMSEGRASTAAHLVMVVDFLAVMAWVMVAVGGLGLASTMSLAVLERTREIGVLRAIGARHRTILALVQAEGLAVGLFSWLVAVPLSVPMSAAMAFVFGRIFLRVPVAFVPSPSGVGLWLGLVVAICLAASAWPARRATRVSPVAALAYE